MVSPKHSLGIASVLAALSIQGCMLAPKAPDPHAQQAAWERWNRCQQRFDANLEFYCDGHRRDVLATYPAYLENQIDELLSHTARTKHTSQLMKTGFEFPHVASGYYIPDAVLEPVDAAQQVDL